MNVLLENDSIQVGIKSMGAELYSVKRKQFQLEYMWSGDSAVWGKTSPVLFPIVGALKENTYYYKGKSYSLSRHGFAREQHFQIKDQSKTEVTFVIVSDAESLLKYPFQFCLSMHYKIIDASLEVSYKVENTGKDEMYFSVGAHPAFAVPLEYGLQYDDYYLLFDQKEIAARWPISAAGLIESTPHSLLQNSDKLSLNRKLFAQDALVLKHLKSKSLSLKSDIGSHGLDFDFASFPYLGIWAAKDGDFVCIEPWCGIADSVIHDQNLTTKEGIEKLMPGVNWNRSWKVKFF
ncbi:MAG: aldose 1-epimerase family protein [Chryseolinea sp.]